LLTFLIKKAYLEVWEEISSSVSSFVVTHYHSLPFVLTSFATAFQSILESFYAKLIHNTLLWNFGEIKDIKQKENI